MLYNIVDTNEVLDFVAAIKKILWEIPANRFGIWYCYIASSANSSHFMLCDDRVSNIDYVP